MLGGKTPNSTSIIVLISLSLSPLPPISSCILLVFYGFYLSFISISSVLVYNVSFSYFVISLVSIIVSNSFIFQGYIGRIFWCCSGSIVCSIVWKEGKHMEKGIADLTC